MEEVDKKKLKEAKSAYESGTKNMKKSLFHKPDYTSASSLCEKAGKLFKEMGMLEEQKQAFEKAAIAYDKDGSTRVSCEMFQEAAMAAYKLRDYNETARLLKEGKTRFIEADKIMQCVRYYIEYARQTRDDNPKFSLECYDIALSLVEQYEQYSWEKETFIEVAIYLLEQNKIPECVKAFERAKKAFIAMGHTEWACHMITSIIVIRLSQRDIVAADRVLNEAMQERWFSKSNDMSMCDMLFRGVKNNDGDLIELAQKSLVCEYIKPEIMRMVYQFKGPKSAPKPVDTSVPENMRDDDVGESDSEDSSDMLL